MRTQPKMAVMVMFLKPSHLPTIYVIVFLLRNCCVYTQTSAKPNFWKMMFCAFNFIYLSHRLNTFENTDEILFIYLCFRW